MTCASTPIAIPDLDVKIPALPASALGPKVREANGPADLERRGRQVRDEEAEPGVDGLRVSNGAPVVVRPANLRPGPRLEAQDRRRPQAAKRTLEAPRHVRRARFSPEVALPCLRRRIEYGAVLERTQELHVLGMSPNEGTGRRG